uniref:Transcription factor SPT20 homolog isoform X1 n=1 Tax=Dermatophagoides pteronyssinus TaxID=6956 RepID=A0A6P6XRI5_DERPT|nr:transcription factor SPT20 homolog isoform X1 [Dermatophagoides pteronyssinus]
MSYQQNDSSDDDLNHSSKSIKINNIINGDDNVLQQHCRNYLYDSYLNITSILNSTNNDDDVQQQQRSKKIFGDHLEKMSELCFDQLIGSPPASPSTASTSSINQCICSVAQLSDDEFNLIDNVDLNNEQQQQSLNQSLFINSNEDNDEIFPMNNDDDNNENNINQSDQPPRLRNSNTIGYMTDMHEEYQTIPYIQQSMLHMGFFEGNYYPNKLWTQTNEQEIQREQIEIMDFVDSSNQIISNDNVNDENEDDDDDQQQQQQILDNENLVNIKQSALKLRRMSNEFQQQQRQHSSMIMMNNVINLVKQTLIDFRTYIIEIMFEKYSHFCKNILPYFSDYR